MRRWLEALLAAAMTTTATAAGAHGQASVPPTIPYLALGDSYTIGEGVPEDGRWPLQLARALRAEGIALDNPHIVAATGWTTGELSTALDAAEPLGEYGFVSLLAGVNNQYRYRSRGVSSYRDEFAHLLQRAIGYAGGHADRVLVLSIPDWGVTPFAIAQGRDPAQVARELDAYNAVARELCARHGVVFVDITPASRAHGAHPAMLADDSLHPSAAMYAEWARLALPVARGLLAR